DRYDRCGRLSQKALHYRNAAREELPLLSKRYQYDASDNLIIERLTQTQRSGGSDPRQPLPDDGLLGRFLARATARVSKATSTTPTTPSSVCATIVKVIRTTPSCTAKPTTTTPGASALTIGMQTFDDSLNKAPDTSPKMLRCHPGFSDYELDRATIPLRKAWAPR
ncbi:hypothetical protein, partial [Pseudomonas sp. MWU16-30323]|uniref:hypothetical protein n=1 Tax=Pseudomonas sp. MWU16-30323 TaxID=2878094 RepID=UPI001CFB6C98